VTLFAIDRSPAKNSKTKKGSRRGPKNSRQSSVPRPTMEYRAATAENRAALNITRAFKGPNNKYIVSLFGAIGLVPTSAAPGLQCLNGVGQGTNENTRVGRLARMNWLDLDIACYLNTNASITIPTSMRVYVVVETTALGSALAPSQFFVDAATFTPTSQRDRVNRNASRYVVLYDSGPFVLAPPPVASGLAAPATFGAGLPCEKDFSLHIPLDFSTDYSRGNAGTIADIDTNSLYLMAVTDTATASAAFCAGAWTLCFTDDS
jgi:hypothetical protein